MVATRTRFISHARTRTINAPVGVMRMQRERGNAVNGSTQTTHPSVEALSARLLADERALTSQEREARYQRIAAVCDEEPIWGYGKGRHGGAVAIRTCAAQARKTLTPNEARFWRESHPRWPTERFLRYHDVSIQGSGIGAMLSTAPSVWYAPFYHAKTRTIMVIDDRPDFPYRVYGQNAALYARHGYTTLDFSEDVSCPTDDAVWDEAMALIDAAINCGGAADGPMDSPD